jgi:hypothetical protein
MIVALLIYQYAYFTPTGWIVSELSIFDLTFWDRKARSDTLLLITTSSVSESPRITSSLLSIVKDGNFYST